MKFFQDKWMLFSCLEKSLRRGCPDLSSKYASVLYDIDENFLYYKLSNFCLDEIGLANISLIKKFLSTQCKKNNIDSLGGKEFIKQYVIECANSVKDRSVSDLNYLAIASGIKIEKNNERIFLNKEYSLTERFIAGWNLLSAQKLINPLIDRSESFKKLDFVLNVLEIDSDVVDICRDAYIVHREPNFIGLMLLSKLFEKEKGDIIDGYKTGSVVKKICPPTLIANNLLLEAIDWNTKEGKSCIHNYTKENNDFISWLKFNHISNDSMAFLIGTIFFRYQGHLVDKRLIYPSAIKIFKLVQKVEFEKLTENKIKTSDLIDMFHKYYPEFKNYLIKQINTPDPKFFPF